MVSAIMALAFATFINNKPMDAQLYSYVESGYENAVDWTITEGVVDSSILGRKGDGELVFAFCNLDVIDYTDIQYSLCDDCMDAFAEGYNYIYYGNIPAHDGDWVTTFEAIDANGECIARWDYIDYCPHNN